MASQSTRKTSNRPTKSHLPTVPPLPELKVPSDKHLARDYQDCSKSFQTEECTYQKSPTCTERRTDPVHQLVMLFQIITAREELKKYLRNTTSSGRRPSHWAFPSLVDIQKHLPWLITMLVSRTLIKRMQLPKLSSK